MEQKKPAYAGFCVPWRMGASRLLGSREGFERRGDARRAAAPGSRYVTESLPILFIHHPPTKKPTSPVGFF
jgi:hypothetical protein